jgi:hypothetical protein
VDAANSFTSASPCVCASMLTSKLYLFIAMIV